VKRFTRSRRAALGTALLCLGLGASAPAQAAPSPNQVSQDLRRGVTVGGMQEHLQALQNIASFNNGTRASGTAGYDASVDYVKARLEDAGLDVTVQPFDFAFFRETGPSSFARTAPTATTYDDTQYDVMDYSGSGTVTDTAVQPVDLSLADRPASTSGCQTDDFAGFTAGNVALMQRGGCPFGQKAANAETAGASAAIIMNQGDTDAPDRNDLFQGTLGNPVGIPAISVSFPLGQELSAAGTRVSIHTETESEIRETSNVIAELAPKSESKAGKTVVVGAHLDSVIEGPGINDNGSGSAAILEIAEEMAERKAPANPVRFAFWGAEEANLLGSTHYVTTLPQAERDRIGLNLNFDMLGSPNFVRFVYDGDGNPTGTAGPGGSAEIEQVFNAYFASQNLPTEPTAFDGRSDYGPFIAAGIPAGGLFSGAEGIKTAEQAEVYGGVVGEAYDRCYHESCDTISNINWRGLHQLADGAAHATAVYASAKAAPPKGGKQSMSSKTFRGSHAQR
jgi:Zn-dependent M28 family amino/carboxypeptidase